MWLFLILVIVPIIEIALFIQVGGAIGTWATLAIVVLTAFLGTVLLRSQGGATLRNLQGSIANGGNPADHLAHGALILVSGIVLLTPGFFTDAIGLALLVPGIRSAVIKYMAARITHMNVHVQGFEPQQQNSPVSDDIIEGEFEDLDEKGPRGNSGWTKSNE